MVAPCILPSLRPVDSECLYLASGTSSYKKSRVELDCQVLSSAVIPSPASSRILSPTKERHFIKKGRKRVTTTYRCKQCKVPLCVVPCFELYGRFWYIRTLLLPYVFHSFKWWSAWGKNLCPNVESGFAFKSVLCHSFVTIPLSNRFNS